MAGFNLNYKSNAPTGVVGKLFFSLFFLFFLGMGLLFAWLIVRDVAAGLKTWAWKKTDCEIVASRVSETGPHGRHTGSFYVQVEYRYTFDGQKLTADKYQLKPKSFTDYGKAARLAGQYQPGSSAVCYVNPSAPTDAVLHRDSLLSPLALLFPLVFVLIGAGGIFLMWRPQSASVAAPQPISNRAIASNGQRFMFVFFMIFLLVGCGAFYGIFIRPVWSIQRAKQWPVVPCVVISSEVQSHSGDKGTTYSINILYRYEFNGREFKANRYDFMGGSSSGYAGKQAVVNKYPPGRQAICYVNPDEPTEAVLERGFTPVMWGGLFPLIFVLVGAGGIYFTARQRRNSLVTGGAIPASTYRPVGIGGLPNTLVLKPKMPPFAKLFVIIAVALFWNGIVSVFVAEVVRGWRSGHAEWFLTLFLVPFVLIGLGLMAGIIYQFLALWNPRPRLKVTPGAVALGGALRVQWELKGRTSVLKGLRVSLQGREEATYRRGTNTVTDKSVFLDLEIAKVTALAEMQSGTRTVNIPAHLMHSFASKNNKIFWSIFVHGEISRWPDVKEEFPLTVLPTVRTTARTQT
ncbi:MAG: hypothetical protein JWR19_262 [Pedosphaera sp.]|nr:hypothetical protein [Pedosphaera sp.]